MILHVVGVVAAPLLLAGVVRKTKARMQGRPGPPFFQPFYDLVKRLRKGETVSTTASWVFRVNPLIGLAIAVLVALVVPWTGAAPVARGSGAADLILIVYLLAAARFVSMLAALDTGSAFGGLGASREATIGVLIEPSILISLGAAAITRGSTDLSVALDAPLPGAVALLAGAAFFLAALAELSRMPVDDPTTHLELTMVHEAAILENGGRNLGLIELTVALRSAVFIGLGTRIWLAGFAPTSNQLLAGLIGIGGILVVGALLGVFEGVAVKLNWRRVPSFVALLTALAVMAAFVATGSAS